jgi:hypothetical protein
MKTNSARGKKTAAKIEPESEPDADDATRTGATRTKPMQVAATA